MNQQDNLQNPMQAALKAYSVLESILKQARRDETRISMADIVMHKDAVAAGITLTKARDAVGSFVKKGLVTGEGPKNSMTYMWGDLGATFIPSKTQLERAHMAPGKVTNPMKDNVVVQSSAPTVSKEIELVVGGVTIIIGKNELSGRPRIVIEG